MESKGNGEHRSVNTTDMESADSNLSKLEVKVDRIERKVDLLVASLLKHEPRKLNAEHVKKDLFCGSFARKPSCTTCRNGPDCKYLACGMCWFAHPKEHQPSSAACNISDMLANLNAK
eukprot:9295743-Karenia_brevis.AAC.1